MTDYAELQKRCQRGCVALSNANNLLAECYAAIGDLSGRLECANGDLRQAMQIIEKLTPQADLYQQVQRAAGELPHGFEIRICVERDAGYAELWDEDGCEVDFPNSCETLSMTVSDAIDHATGKDEN